MPYKFEYEIENKKKNLSEEEHNHLSGLISKNWDKWDELRAPCLDAIRAVERFIYPAKNYNSAKFNVSMPEIYEIRETYKAHLWKSWFSSVESMFDVQGKSRKDQEMASQQKAFLVDTFKDINIPYKLEKGLDNWINKGEFIAFVNWNTRVKQVRRKELVQAFDENAETPKYVQEYIVKDEVVYDGPDIEIVDPEAFVFEPDKKENFDSCPKIYRSWATFEDIASNKLYKNYESLKELVGDKSQGSESKTVKGDQIEVLEYWGDVKLKDGTLLKNYLVTLAGREKVIRFEPNPFIVNPFVFASFLEEPATKRGLSPLFVAIPLNEVSDTILNLQLDALKLIINKPYLAPKGSLSGKISVKEGSIIEYDPALMPKEPIPLDFKDALVGWDFLEFFENKIEATTGIFKYMSGDAQGSRARTATESTGLMLSQNVRLSKEVDTLNFKVKIPIIQKIADLIANFSFEMKEIRISFPNGDTDYIFVDDTVKQGNYDYIIGDNAAVLEKKAKLKESLEVLFKFSAQPEVAARIKWLEVLKWTFEQIGVADPNVFIRHDEV